MAEILEGLLLINQTDVYARFGAFLAETAEDRHDNYDSLLAPPALKQQAEVSIQEEDGVRMPDILTQTYEARDITLRFAIVASNDVSFFTRYASFVKFLKEGDDGWLALHLTDWSWNIHRSMILLPDTMKNFIPCSRYTDLPQD